MGKLIPFPDVSSDGKIETRPFIAAARSVLEHLDKYGPVYNFATHHMINNVESLEKIYRENPKDYHTLNSMILIEKQEGGDDARASLLWLRRGLEFFFVVIDKVVNQRAEFKIDQDLKPVILEAYEEVLEEFHGYGKRQTIRENLEKNCPTFKDFIHIMEADSKLSMMDLHSFLPSYINGIRRNTQAIYKLYKDNNLNLDAKAP